MLELVEWSIVVLIYTKILLLQSFQLILMLISHLNHPLKLGLQFAKISCTSFHVLLSFKQENFLLLVVRLHRLCKGILPVLEHFN